MANSIWSIQVCTTWTQPDAHCTGQLSNKWRCASLHMYGARHDSGVGLVSVDREASLLQDCEAGGWQTSVKPIGYSWSYLTCRIGHLVPIEWCPCVAPGTAAAPPRARRSPPCLLLPPQPRLCAGSNNTLLYLRDQRAPRTKLNINIQLEFNVVQ
jgi:hypothetical protein